MPRLHSLTLLCLLAAPAARAQQQSGAFIVRLGRDTLFVEQYTRSPGRLEGDQISRMTTQTLRRHFVASFDQRGDMTKYEVWGRPAGDSTVQPQVLRVTFTRDTAEEELTVGDSTIAAHVAIRPGTIAFMNYSYALLELLTQRARANPPGPGEAAGFEVLPLGSGSPFAVTIQPLGGDTLMVAFGDGGPIRVRTDPSGRILAATDAGTNQQTTERVAALDIETLSRAFASRPMAVLSPRDSVQANIGRAVVSINYGRPWVRGREIFGNVVPWNKVWRTGANAPTTLTTSSDLVMGGKTIPAGRYSLWTLPTPQGWTLILNSRIDQNGTRYDSTRDVARLGMRVALLPEPVEQLTIAVQPQNRGGVLKVAWESTEASVPFTVR
jgi:hypothetical protein